MPHKSLRMSGDLWGSASKRASERGFVSTNEYIRFLIKEDLERQLGLEQMEESIVSSISKVSSRVTSLGTMNQASFSVLWSLAEVILRASPEAAPLDRRAEDRIERFRLKVAGEIRSNAELKNVLLLLDEQSKKVTGP